MEVGIEPNAILVYLFIYFYRNLHDQFGCDQFGFDQKSDVICCCVSHSVSQTDNTPVVVCWHVCVSSFFF